jgi:hypothetical protein
MSFFAFIYGQHSGFLVNYILSCIALIHTMDTVLETTLSVLNFDVIYYYLNTAKN